MMKMLKNIIKDNIEFMWLYGYFMCVMLLMLILFYIAYFLK